MIDDKSPPPGLFLYRAKTAFDELDPLGILHNSRYLYFLERATLAMFDHLMGAERFDPEAYPDLYVLVRRLEIDYLAPIRGVIPFLITLRVSRLREAGCVYAFEFRSENGETLFSKGTRTVVRMSGATGEPTAWTPQFRSIYGKWEKAGKEKSKEF
ncbi:MAG: thioesterase family protein [Opitutales bacterium]